MRNIEHVNGLMLHGAGPNKGYNGEINLQAREEKAPGMAPKGLIRFFDIFLYKN
jgi:hypothetical protein